MKSKVFGVKFRSISVPVELDETLSINKAAINMSYTEYEATSF